MVKKEKIDDSKKLTSDFTDSFIEKIILNKVFTEKQYTLFFEGIFDKRWFEDDRIAGIINLILLYKGKNDMKSL